ncbi:MAG: DegT/DnrJ/EryC1/StrS family aminotransferase [Bacteroidales bacterium]|nr:DegT/DnrJ/EryC1/StrS family aminotransferase [Bacteroidales bacterium]
MPGMEFFGAEERKEVMDVLETGALFRYNHDEMRKGHWKAKDLEAEVRKFTGAKYAHAVSSGSTAVAAALAAAGIGHGDEVIVPPFTYIASNEAVIYAGGLPVFAEIDENLCLSVEGIKKALTPKTKAVLLVHMCGAAADMDAITALCKEKNLVLIEDAGQAMGAFYKGKSVGLFGKTGAFSFDFFKITTCGEGGLFITDDEQAYKNADSFSDHGHDHIGNNRGMENHPVLGFNYRISELHAAVGVAQMRKINKIRDAKKANQQYMKEKLSVVKGLTFRPVPDPEGDSGTFLNFFLPSTEMAGKVMAEFGKSGVAGCNYWFTNMYHFINQWDHFKNLRSAAPLAIHHLGAPQDYNNLELPKSQEVVGRLISLGVRATWTKKDMDELAEKMISSIQKVIE